jgi:hypothetical protein
MRGLRNVTLFCWRLAKGVWRGELGITADGAIWASDLCINWNSGEEVIQEFQHAP